MLFSLSAFTFAVQIFHKKDYYKTNNDRCTHATFSQLISLSTEILFKLVLGHCVREAPRTDARGGHNQLLLTPSSQRSIQSNNVTKL